jgi:hypothetical protein
MLLGAAAGLTRRRWGDMEFNLCRATDVPLQLPGARVASL